MVVWCGVATFPNLRIPYSKIHMVEKNYLIVRTSPENNRTGLKFAS